MELASNLLWLAFCAVLFASTVRTLRRGTLKVAPGTAFTAMLAVCLLLLPVISMSDDLLQARQNNLPLAAQTWHLASEGAAHGLEVTTLLGAFLLLLFSAFLPLGVSAEPEQQTWRHSAWLVRAQRLRPPPARLR